MQPLSRDGLTADQVRAAITGPSPVVSWGADLLDRQGVFVRDLSDDLLECTVSRRMYADVHGTVDLSIAAELDWGNARVRPWLEIGGARFFQGAYDLVTPESATQDGIFRVQGMDPLHLLQSALGDTWTVTAGTGYLDAVRSVLAARGPFGSAVLLDSAADALTLPAPMVWVHVFQSPVSILRVANDLLAAVGYRGLWCDENGNYRSEPYRTPAERGPDWVFDTSDVATDVVLPERSIMLDDWQRPSSWSFMRRGLAYRPTEGDGLYTVSSSGGGPWCPVFYELDAADQASLVAQGDAQVIIDSSRSRLIDIRTGPLPMLSHFDVATYVDAAMGVSALVQVRSWDLPLHGGDTALTLEVVSGA